MRQHKDLTGKRFGHLIALEYLGRGVTNKPTYRCLCDCGNIVDVVSERLTGGYKTSCGCATIRSGSIRNGESSTRLYRIWVGMKYR